MARSYPSGRLVGPPTACPRFSAAAHQGAARPDNDESNDGNATISSRRNEESCDEDGNDVVSLDHRVQKPASPLVAVGYGPRCVPIMQLLEAATGLCDLLWIIDSSAPDMVEMRALLARFGPVIDTSGRSRDELLRELGEYDPSGFVTYLDAGMVAYAELAQALGLPFHSPATALALTDKARQREVLAAAGLVVPRCHVLARDATADAIAELALRWPAVLKPRSAQGSRRTFLVESPDQAAALVAELGPFEVEMVLEDYIEGRRFDQGAPYADYVSVESLVANGVVSHIAITGRFPLAENFRETGFFIPAALDETEASQVLETATRALAALGVTVGCCHTEVKLTPDGPQIIEVNGRVGGGVPEMLVRAAHLPLVELTLRVALGEEQRVDGPVPVDRVGYRLFLQPPAMSAVVDEIEGVDAVAAHPAVDTVSIHQGPGAGFDWRDGSRSHILAVVGTAADHRELLAVERLLRDKVTVTYSESGT